MSSVRFLTYYLCGHAKKNAQTKHKKINQNHSCTPSEHKIPDKVFTNIEGNNFPIEMYFSADGGKHIHDEKKKNFAII